MQLVNVDRDLFLIPSLAIHMNRSVNDGYAYKVQRDLLPLYGAAEAPDLTALVAETAGISPESVIGHDLFVYNRQAPSIWGADRGVYVQPETGRSAVCLLLPVRLSGERPGGKPSGPCGV